EKLAREGMVFFGCARSRPGSFNGRRFHNVPIEPEKHLWADGEYCPLVTNAQESLIPGVADGSHATVKIPFHPRRQAGLDASAKVRLQNITRVDGSDDPRHCRLEFALIRPAAQASGT